ncbi:hypothetical protein DQQ10_11105 [Pseudochryseolinea flava]|uniref:Uncharacterized protein n=1 Tax=Pseudochryseolinea flava TaxID=2059302 RepID=A0A364Y5V3_9BACT|nr:hypothetical protein DQQ10_11105 [Pseudochryseolinea flava]
MNTKYVATKAKNITTTSFITSLFGEAYSKNDATMMAHAPFEQNQPILSIFSDTPFPKRK